MNSSKVKTQKNLSALIAIALAAVTLFQASSVKSNESNRRLISKEEAQLISEIEADLSMDDDFNVMEEVYMEMEETNTELVKVFDAEGKLIEEGNPAKSEGLRQLVNKADFLTESLGSKYYRISE